MVNNERRAVRGTTAPDPKRWQGGREGGGGERVEGETGRK